MHLSMWVRKIGHLGGFVKGIFMDYIVRLLV